MVMGWLIRSGVVLALLVCVMGQALAQSGDTEAAEIPRLRNILSVQPQAPGAECSRESESEGSSLLFVVDKAGAPIFATADAATAQGGEALRLGKLLFADDVRSDCARVRVFTLTSDSVVGRVGWMRTEDLLVERRSAVEIGQAIAEGLPVERSNVDGGFNEGNALKLRFVTVPQLRVKLGGRPGDDGGEELATFRWFYVYDIEQHDGEAWGLVGETARLFPDGTIEDTDATAGERRLLGWAPLSELQIWATNLVLEINTHPDAVAQRRERGHGARVLALRHAGSRIIYDEPLDYFWPEGAVNPALRGEVDFDPYGIAPEFPRLAVVQAYPEHIAIASAGSRDDKLSPSSIGRIRRKVNNVARDLQKVDIIFVLDTTGSMKRAIERTRDFIADINADMRAAASSGGSTVVDLGMIGEIEISTNLDIAVSLIGFQDVSPAVSPAYTTKEYFTGLDVVRDFSGISAAFSRVTEGLAGSREALHHGVQRALEGKYWREGSSSRLIIVITDEPGDTSMQQQIYDQLPTYSEDLLQVRPSLGSISPDEQKKEITKIYSIYLGTEEGRRPFHQKSAIYSREIFEIIDFVDQGRTKEFRDALGEVLVEQQSRIVQNTEAFVEVLKRGEYSYGETGGFPGLTELAVRQAMDRQGIAFHEVDQLNEVISFTGYVDLDSVGGLSGGGGAESRIKDWRTRVHLERETVGKLHIATNSVARALGHLLEEDDLFRDLDAQDQGTRRELVGMLMLLVRDVVTGRNELSTGVEGREVLRQTVRKLLALVETNARARDATFARFLEIDSSLPIRTDGLLSVPLGEMLARTKDWFVVQSEAYLLKAQGLERILRNKPVPEDFRTLITTASGEKRWFTPSGINAVEEYGYIPPGYLP